MMWEFGEAGPIQLEGLTNKWSLPSEETKLGHKKDPIVNFKALFYILRVSGLSGNHELSKLLSIQGVSKKMCSRNQGT